MKALRAWLTIRRMAAVIAQKPDLCHRCTICWSTFHRPCYTVGCQCRCSHLEPKVAY